MFDTIAESLEHYKSELRSYVVWLAEWRVVHTVDFGSYKQVPGHPLESPFAPENDKAVKWSAELIGAEKTLGLSKDEINQIHAECGFEAYHPT